MSLTLFTVIDFVPQLSEQAILIEPFRVLHTMAYNKRKGDTQGRERKRAIEECRYIYHMYHYASEFSEYDKEERHREALISAGLTEKFVISKELQACIDIFIKLQSTRMLKTLATAENALDKAREYYDSVDFTILTDKGELLHNIKNVMASISDLGVTNKKLEDLKKLVKAQLKETTALRGDHEGGYSTAK